VRVLRPPYCVPPPPPVLSSLSLHDALPIWRRARPPTRAPGGDRRRAVCVPARGGRPGLIPVVTRRRGRPPTGRRRGRRRRGRSRSEEHTLNSSHVKISYAVFCLKKKATQPK